MACLLKKAIYNLWRIPNVSVMPLPPPPPPPSVSPSGGASGPPRRRRKRSRSPQLGPVRGHGRIIPIHPAWARIWQLLDFQKRRFGPTRSQHLHREVWVRKDSAGAVIETQQSVSGCLASIVERHGVEAIEGNATLSRMAHIQGFNPREPDGTIPTVTHMYLHRNESQDSSECSSSENNEGDVSSGSDEGDAPIDEQIIEEMAVTTQFDHPGATLDYPPDEEEDAYTSEARRVHEQLEDENKQV